MDHCNLNKTNKAHVLMTPSFRQICRRTLLFASLLLAFSHQTQAANEADVIVYGSTPGGFCAAIAAAREGASVILLEPTAHVGGVNTGGIDCFDATPVLINCLIVDNVVDSARWWSSPPWRWCWSWW